MLKSGFGYITVSLVQLSGWSKGKLNATEESFGLTVLWYHWNMDMAEGAFLIHK